MPWLTQCFPHVTTAVLWAATAVLSNGFAAAAQVVTAEAPVDQNEQLLSESAELALPALAPCGTCLSCHWAVSLDLMCPCSRSTAARFSGRLCGTF